VNTLVLRNFLLLLGDISLLYLSLFLTVFFDFGMHFLPFSILYLFWLITFYIFGLYDLSIIRRKVSFFPRIIWAIATCFILGVIFFYLLPVFGITPKTNLALNILIFGVLLIVWRNSFYSLFFSRLLNKAAIVGDGSQNLVLAEEIRKRPYLGYKAVELDNNKTLLEQIKEKGIDTLIVPDDIQGNSELVSALYQCLPARVSFLNWSRAYENICSKVPVSFVAKTWFLENIREGEKSIYDSSKRAIDIILAGLLLIITLPLWLFIAILIKIEDGGAAIYWQKRIGKDGKPFLLYKFRSMKTGAENETGAVWAEKGDPRTTKIGKTLRRLHLDELPQMVNVLRGDISLVGPRPERPEFVLQLTKEIPHYDIRQLIKPGFTGWAQIKFRYGRTVMDAREKFEYDLFYLKNRSLILDMGILLKTLQLFFQKD
jgi:exopolysaccharide biosynthesis polyprenyl glycosylphosphotransferase